MSSAITDSLRVEREGGLTWLVLNRPERRNALDLELMGNLGLAIEELRNDSETQVVAIRGEGPSFCTGYDISPNSGTLGSVTESDPLEDWHLLNDNVSLFLRFWDLPKPVICAIHGYCLGGATQLAALCDLIVVTNDSVVGNARVPMGAGYIIPTMALSIGIRRAKEMIFVTGRDLSGPETVEWGWANRSVEPDRLLDEVRAMAAAVMLTPAPLVTANKIAMNRLADLAGFRTALSLMPDMDAISHKAAAALEVGEYIQEHGLREALKKYWKPR